MASGLALVAGVAGGWQCWWPVAGAGGWRRWVAPVIAADVVHRCAWRGDPLRSTLCSE